MKKEPRPSNFGTAIYIAETYGWDVDEETLLKVAKEFHFQQKRFLENYRLAAAIRKLCDKYKKE